MKKLILILLFALLSGSTMANPIVAADTLRIDGKLVLWLKVSGYEAGWHYGMFLGDRIAEVMENYVINHTFGGANGYNYASQIFDQKFIYDYKYEEIAQGMIAGMEDADIDIFSPSLQRDLTFKDVLIANSIPDFTAFSKLNIKGPGCSDLMSWGDATLDSDLDGELVISRNLDWENNPYLIDNALIIVWGSYNWDAQRIITFGFTGLIGALSGFNETGITTFQNMGNYSTAPVGDEFYPVNLAQRDGLESWDYNNDGVCSPRDVSDAVRAHNVAATYIINTAGPNYFETPAEILEIHNSYGDTIRTVTDNPEFFGDNLVSTNHFRLLKSPTPCYRYSRIADSLQNSNLLDISRNWNVLKAAGVTTNLQTIQYIPAQHFLRFSFAEIGTPAYMIEATELHVDSLFALVGVNETGKTVGRFVSVSPNPCSNQCHIKILAPMDGTAFCKIMDLTGKLIFEKNLRIYRNESLDFTWETIENLPGIYFNTIELVDRNQRRIAAESQKIVVTR